MLNVTPFRRCLVSLRLILASASLACGSTSAIALKPGLVKHPGVTIDNIMAVRDLYGLSISPDGRSIAAFETRLDANETSIMGCWLIISVTTGAVRARSAPYRVVMDDAGLVASEAPKWSPDSSAIAFRVGTEAGPKLMMLNVNGSATAVSLGAGEAVARFVYDRDGQLIIESAGTAEEFLAAENLERARGVNVDTVDAAEPLFGNQYTGSARATVRYENSSTRRWSVRLGEQKRYWRWNSETGGRLLPSGASDLFLPQKAAEDVGGYVLQNDGPAPNDRSMPPQLKRLAQKKDRGFVVCDDPRCRGRSIKIIGVDQASEAVLFTREGLSDTRGLYRWRPSEGVRTLFGERGALSGSSRDGQQPCLLSRSEIFCVYADPWTPPEITKTNISNGSTSVFYFANRPMAALKGLEIRQVAWRGPNPGLSSGVLVLPRNRTGRLPLVVSSYRCRGFLRGGVGFDALEYVLASRGIAALCVTLSEESLGDTRPLGIHRRFSEEIASGVKYLTDMGIADPDRVGVSGRSLSAEAISYAITHGQKFAAASAVGSSIADPIWSKLNDLSEGAFFPVALYYHHLAVDGSDAAETSPAMNAGDTSTPLLMQPPEKEFRGALEFYYALKKLKKPVEMIIYPDEEHQIAQPRHMRRNADRNLDWFLFWLMNEEDQDIGKKTQYANWRRMRASAPRIPANSTLNQSIAS